MYPGRSVGVKDILPDLDLWQSQGEEIALATVVRVQRSAPRPPGARLCATRSGRMSGSVSGGCVEADVLVRAMQVLDTRTREVVSYGIADELGFQVGLSCGGSIDVLIEPYAASEDWDALRRSVERRHPSVYAVGLSPAPLLGRKLTMVTDGPAVGSIAPSLDGRIVELSDRLLQTGGTRVVNLPWQGEQAQVFLEAFRPTPSLLIVGATHVAISLCRLAAEVGFEVTIIDARSALATLERFPDAGRLIRAWPDEALAQVSLDSDSYLVVLTHDPKFDIPTLASALRSQVRYMGALGSRVTHEARREELRRQGFSDADLARIRSPIGLDIGSRTPAEIALAILAEVLAVRYDRV